MRLYWRTRKKGLDLVVENDEKDIFIVRGVRETKRGIEALAKTTGYDPSRAVKGLSSVEEGKIFVENFQPWMQFFPGEDLNIEME